MNLNIQRNIDKYAGYIIILILVLFKPIKLCLKPKGKNIVIIRLWTLGDTTMCLPTIKKLKNENYNVDVICTARSNPVLEKTDFIDNIIILSPKIIKKLFYYDYAIDTEPYFNISAIIAFLIGKKTIGFSNLFRRNLYNYKTKYDDNIHNVLNYAKLLKHLNINFQPKELIPLNYNEPEKNTINLNLKNTKAKLIGIHMGSAETSTYRVWKPKYFENLIKKILKENKDITIVLTGSKKEGISNKKLIEKLSSKNIINISNTTVGELAYLMTKLSVFVDNDTGTMHVAAAMKCPTIGLFGPNLPRRFRPFGKGNIAIYKAENLKCSPCINPHLGKFKKCQYQGKCMDLISVDEVYSEIKKLI